MSDSSQDHFTVAGRKVRRGRQKLMHQPTTAETPTMRERLADIEHQQWAHWTRYMLDNLTPENIERWQQQIETPYADLSEFEKNSDRKWADIVVSEMLEPSEGMKRGLHMSAHDCRQWNAGVQHILNETKD